MRHLDYLVSEFTTYYNTRRAHMDRDHLSPIRDVPEEFETLTMDQTEVNSYVGGWSSRSSGRRLGVTVAMAIERSYL